MPRIIYCLEVFDEDNDVVVRRFFRNLRSADRALSSYPDSLTYISVVPKSCYDFVLPYVEG